MSELRSWMDPEERAYPRGALVRNALVRIRVNPYRPECLASIAGQFRRVKAGIPDSFFTVPAKYRFRGKTIHGYLSVNTDDYELEFTPERYQKGDIRPSSAEENPPQEESE